MSTSKITGALTGCPPNNVILHAKSIILSSNSIHEWSKTPITSSLTSPTHALGENPISDNATNITAVVA